jgi:hypothetical protein
MKTHALPLPRLTAISLAAVLACLPQVVGAEDQPTARPKTTSVSAESAPPGYDLEIIDGKQVGASKARGLEATLGNVVDALRDRYPKANIVMAPGLAKLKISDLKLRAGRLADELEAVRVASGAKFDWMGPGFAGPNIPPMQGIDPTTGLPTATNPTESNTGLFVLREPAPTPETARTVEAFNIDPYLRWLRENQDANETKGRREEEVVKRLDELEQMVARTLSSLKPGSAVEMPTFQFHRGANLLIVVGTTDAVDVARKVVNALPGQADFGGGGGGRYGGIGGPGMSPEAQEAFRQRYGLAPRPGSLGLAPAPAAPPPPIPTR